VERDTLAGGTGQHPTTAGRIPPRFSRLVVRFQRRLLVRQKCDWSFDLDETLIDASRLDRVVVNPGFASAYKRIQAGV
jgi:cobalamin biosynthesis protein CobT